MPTPATPPPPPSRGAALRVLLGVLAAAGLAVWLFLRRGSC